MSPKNQEDMNSCGYIDINSTDRAIIAPVFAARVTHVITFFSTIDRWNIAGGAPPSFPLRILDDVIDCNPRISAFRNASLCTRLPSPQARACEGDLDTTFGQSDPFDPVLNAAAPSEPSRSVA